MKLLFASDSFKGSLTSEKTNVLLTKAAKEVFGECECVGLPVADGGEGTVDAVIAAENGKKIFVKTHGPMMDEIEAYYGVFGKDKAIIEMASASGLTLVDESRRDVRNATTFGTGEMILDAIEKGYRDISIAIGGSATNEAGMGCARALGVRFLDKCGNELSGVGSDLAKVDHIDMSAVDERVKKAKITVMCDVTNPLCGENGATRTYAKQKGASIEVEDELEKGMLNFKDVIEREFGIDCNSFAGAGAAGGLGAALKVFFNGEIKSGIETVLELIHFDERLSGVNLVVTGEGRTDHQSCFGKVMRGVGMHAKSAGIPAVGLSGSLGDGASSIFDYGIESLITSVSSPMTLEEAIDKSEQLYYDAALRMFRLIKVGMKI